MIRWFIGLPRHVRLAIILAPFLGIFGWGLADTWMRPNIEQARQEVAVREMVVTDQCLLKAAQCQLSKDEMTVKLASVAASETGLLRINISSNQHIRGLKMAIVQNGEETRLIAQPTRVTDRWFVEFPARVLHSANVTLRIAIAQTKRVYLAEFPAQF